MTPQQSAFRAGIVDGIDGIAYRPPIDDREHYRNGWQIGNDATKKMRCEYSSDERDTLTAEIASLQMRMGKLNAEVANLKADVECWKIKHQYAQEQLRQIQEVFS